MSHRTRTSSCDPAARTRVATHPRTTTTPPPRFVCAKRCLPRKREEQEIDSGDDAPVVPQKEVGPPTCSGASSLVLMPSASTLMHAPDTLWNALCTSLRSTCALRGSSHGPQRT